MTDNLYFEPPSRLQLVEKLAHILRFSDAFLVLAGPYGSGISTVVEQLHANVIEDDNYILSLVLEGNTNLNTLLKLLNSGVDELVQNNDESGAEDVLSALHRKIESLGGLGRRLLISIDNSHFMSDEAIESLSNLLSANQGKIAVVLAGLETLVPQISALGLAEELESGIQTEILGPFNKTETEEFLQLRFVRGNDLSKKQISSIYLNSEGYPGRITAIASELIKSGKITLGGKAGFLPLPHLVGIGVLLTAITAVSSWQFFADDFSDPTVEESTRSTVNLDIVADAGDVTLALVPTADNSNDNTEDLNLKIEQLSEKIKAQEVLIAKSQEQVESNSFSPDDKALDVTASDAPLTLLVDDVNTTEQSVPLSEESQDTNITLSEETDSLINQPLEVTAPETESAPVVVTPPLTVATDISEPVQDVALASANVSTEADTAALKADSELTFTGSDMQQTEIIQPVLKEAAKAVVAPVVKEQQEATPVIKTVSKNDTKKVVEKVAAKTEKPKKAKVVAVKTDPQAASYRGESTIKKWPSSGYTLQLLGARSEASIVQFLKTMPNSEKMYYFQTKLKGKPWNVIIYGQYATRSSAKSAIAGLPAKLRQQKPWIKSIKSVQSDIKK